MYADIKHNISSLCEASGQTQSEGVLRTGLTLWQGRFQREDDGGREDCDCRLLCSLPAV